MHGGISPDTQRGLSGESEHHPKRTQWRLECLGHSLIEGLASLLPGSWAFKLGEALGGIVWHFMPQRRKIILRNLRIAFAGEMDAAEIEQLAKASFVRTAANMISVAHTANLPASKLPEVLEVSNPELLEETLAAGKGVVFLLSHMGNWELLSRMVHFFPKGTKAGAFYRPLSNRLLDERVLRRREADGTRMFSKGDNFLQVAAYLREGAAVGILADQRVGKQGELTHFFGRLTRSSPLPSLLARRAKSPVLAISLVTVSPGKWHATYIPLDGPPNTENCMRALETAMAASPADVFWFQERWKIYINAQYPIPTWLDQETSASNKHHRALLWLVDVAQGWRLPEVWIHPDVVHEAALPNNTPLPAWLPQSTRIHRVCNTDDRDSLRKRISQIDTADPLPLDYILTPKASKALAKVAKAEQIKVVALE